MDRKDIDAVVVATPDHIHAIATLLALQAGKHVYCEKPLTHNVAEARKVAAAAKKYNRVTQMGTQIHAGDNYRRVVELIRAGAIGPVREVYLWVGTSWSGDEKPKAGETVPAGLHCDLWLGPAAERPYSAAYLPRTWRGWWDFGGGTLADMGCHYYDLAQWALGLTAPVARLGRGAAGRSAVRPGVADGTVRIPGHGDSAGPDGHLELEPQAEGARRPDGETEMGRRGTLRRREGNAAGRLHEAQAAAGGQVRRLHAAAADDPEIASAITRNGSRRARATARRPARSATPAR